MNYGLNLPGLSSSESAGGPERAEIVPLTRTRFSPQLAPMVITLRSKLARWLSVLVGAALFLVATAWIARAYLAGHYASKPTIQDLQLAIKLDPRDADYHLQLGRLYEYLPSGTEPQKAMEEFHRAAALAPYDPEVWINLGGAAEFAGNVSEAEKYLRMADSLAPRVPVYQWPIGNFFLLHGNTQEAFSHFRMVLLGTHEYDQIIFSTAWKASGDAEQILQQLIPRDLSAEFRYLDFLIGSKRLPESLAVWNRIVNTPGTIETNQANRYLDSLLINHMPDEAFRVWKDLLKRGVVRYSAPSTPGDLITNGSLEDDIRNVGFGWRIAPVKDIYAGLDTSTFHSPGHSLVVQFSGEQNLYYRNVLQYVKVEPGSSYRLQAFMKTEGITTDSGPRLEVRDPYDPGALDKLTDNLTGTTEGWTPLLLDFKTGPKTELIVVSITRLPSQKLDNLIAGKVWLDDVRLTPMH